VMLGRIGRALRVTEQQSRDAEHRPPGWCGQPQRARPRTPPRRRGPRQGRRAAEGNGAERRLLGRGFDGVASTSARDSVPLAMWFAAGPSSSLSTSFAWLSNHRPALSLPIAAWLPGAPGAMQ
jgi:hypothetical protein